MGIVSGGIFSLRQKIFKGKIIFLVCCFRRTIKTVFSYVPLGFLGWGGHVGSGRGASCPLTCPGNYKKCCRTSPQCPELHQRDGKLLPEASPGGSAGTGVEG